MSDSQWYPPLFNFLKSKMEKNILIFYLDVSSDHCILTILKRNQDIKGSVVNWKYNSMSKRVTLEYAFSPFQMQTISV